MSPTTLREQLLPALSAVDAILADLDLAPMQVEVVTRRWSGGRRRVGTPGETVTKLPRWVVVREVTTREVASSGGRFEMGDLKVGPIRPYFTEESCDGSVRPGGFTARELDPRVQAEGTEVVYRITPTHSMGTGDGGNYKLVHLHDDDPLAFFLIVRRTIDPSDAPDVHQLPPPR